MRPKPKIPNIFDCPVCSKKTISVTFDKEPNLFDLYCTNCGKKYHYSNPTHLPIKFGCPICNEKAVSIEYVDTTNSIRISCGSCGKASFHSAKEGEQEDADGFSLIPFVLDGGRLGCPNCDFRKIQLKVKLRKDFALVQCGACGLKESFPVTPLDEKVDVYGKFIDTVKANMKIVEQMKPEEIEQLRAKVKLREEARAQEEKQTVIAPIPASAPVKPSFMEKEELFGDEDEEEEKEKRKMTKEKEKEEEEEEEEEDEEDFKLNL